MLKENGGGEIHWYSAVSMRSFWEEDHCHFLGGKKRDHLRKKEEKFAHPLLIS